MCSREGVGVVWCGVVWCGGGWVGGVVVAQRLHTEGQVRVDLLSTGSAKWWERGGDG